MKKKFLRYLAFVGLISTLWISVPRHANPVPLTEGRAPSATFVLEKNSLIDFITSPQEAQFFEFVGKAAVNPCVEYGALEDGWGPLRQEWFNYLDAASYARFRMACVNGWGGDQFNCLDILWGQREDHWDTFAGRTNRAYGIPQALPGSKMASEGFDWETNPRTQIKWGLGYIADRYHTPCSALSHSYRWNWY